ncbi:MAG: hypothetical protein NVS2B7_32340 [Herpetosiphon sp.]
MRVLIAEDDAMTVVRQIAARLRRAVETLALPHATGSVAQVVTVRLAITQFVSGTPQTAGGW